MHSLNQIVVLPYSYLYYNFKRQLAVAEKPYQDKFRLIQLLPSFVSRVLNCLLQNEKAIKPHLESLGRVGNQDPKMGRDKRWLESWPKSGCWLAPMGKKTGSLLWTRGHKWHCQHHSFGHRCHFYPQNKKWEVAIPISADATRKPWPLPWLRCITGSSLKAYLSEMAI